MSTDLLLPTAQLARTFHALSNPTRLEILRRLSRQEQCVCDLQEALAAAQSRLSFHLRVLKEAGLVSDRREGRWAYYSLVPEAMEGLESFLGAARRGELEAAEETCCSR